MIEIKINPQKETGKIKAMHGIGQPPMLGISTEYFKYLKEANIPYSRLHDVGGWFGGNMFVDIPNIFRDFSADVNNPDAYDFTFTDILIKALIENGCEPIYRLGVTIENFHDIKYYRIAPPEDFNKWAEICEHIIRHYNEGWADGFHLNIKYWEIWNEPDGHHIIEENEMWKGTREQYFELYKITSLHLRKCFGNSIKIGGYASCGFYFCLKDNKEIAEAFGSRKPLSKWDSRCKGFIDFFDAFLNFVTENNLPFDFFSHHSYADVEQTVKMQKYCEMRLEKAGFCDTEIMLNEWNTSPQSEKRGSSEACSKVVAMMCAMQNTKMKLMCYYDGRIGGSIYGGLFNPITYKPFPAYYGLYFFGKLFEMGTQIECVCDNENIYVLAAKNNEKNSAILITNTGEDDRIFLPEIKIKNAYIIDEKNSFLHMKIEKNNLILKEFDTVYIEF